MPVRPAHPLPNSYWVLPGRFLAGGYPGQADEGETRRQLRSLLEVGVSFFLDLTEEGELPPYLPLLQEEAGGRQIVCRRRPIPDFGVPGVAEMAAILDTIEGALAAGHTLYLHCWGGSGRTGTVVGCYLVRHGLSGEEAMAEIARLRQGVLSLRPSPETAAQRQFVLEWERGR